MDLEVGAKLDSWLYFHNFWNWISYNYHFTFGTNLMPHAPEAFWPRNRFEDRENDFDSIPFESRFTPQVVATDLGISQKFTSAFYKENADKSWARDADAYRYFLADARSEFPDPLKRRTLLVIGRNSPYYTRQLDPEIQARDDLAIADTMAGLESLGYGAVSYGRDFSDDDFGDRTHLTTSGGAKLAGVIAPAIAAMAQKLNYLQP
jgi:hypothetical protein